MKLASDGPQEGPQGGGSASCPPSIVLARTKAARRVEERNLESATFTLKGKDVSESCIYLSLNVYFFEGWLPKTRWRT